MMRGLDRLYREKVAPPPWCYVGFSSDSGSFSRASGALGLAGCCTAVTLLLDATFGKKPPSFFHSFESPSDCKALLPSLRALKHKTACTLGTGDKLVKATCPCWTCLLCTKPQAIWQRGEGWGVEVILQLMRFERPTADKELPLPSRCHVW